jgi:hypothetical protein
MSHHLSAKARRAIQARMSPEQREREDQAKLAILNAFMVRHGQAELSMEQAYGVA